MTGLTPHLVVMFAATTGVGFLMMLLGLQKSLLERRTQRRSCPSCGRDIQGRVCSVCAG